MVAGVTVTSIPADVLVVVGVAVIEQVSTPCDISIPYAPILVM